MLSIYFVLVLVSHATDVCTAVSTNIHDFTLYECPQVQSKYIRSQSNVKTDFITAKNFCESHGASMPLFRSNQEARSVYDCLNPNTYGCGEYIAILIGVQGSDLVWRDEAIDTSFLNSYHSSSGDCADPTGREFCCATMNIKHGRHINGMVQDSGAACDRASYPFICEVDSKVEILGDECSQGLDKCSHDCIDEFLGYKCSCPVGYTLQDEHNCVDIDECNQTTERVCEQICNNTPGSFTCLCDKGYEQSSTDQSQCINIDECKTGSSGCNQTCTDSDGSYACGCWSGYVLSSNSHDCLDIDECAAKSHKCNQSCVNTPGSYTCQCSPGFNLASDSFSCHDIDECDTGTHKCNQTCVNTPGSYSCQCSPGFKLANDSFSCHDIDECDTGTHKCDNTCVNTPGSYSCQCSPGFSLANDSFSCHDIDECDTGTHKCNQSCVNTSGSYSCQCSPGFKLASDSLQCHDVNECDEGSHACNQSCVNTPGSYSCECFSGFTLTNDSFNCYDFDECQTDINGSAVCEHECVNTRGSYECLCPDGSPHTANTSCPKLSPDCPCTSSVNVSDEVLERIRREIMDLLLEKTALSSYTRALTSAEDHRISARVMGCTGVAIIMIATCLIVFIDLDRLLETRKHLCYREGKERKGSSP